jgi:hypothetical protein
MQFPFSFFYLTIETLLGLFHGKWNDAEECGEDSSHAPKYYRRLFKAIEVPREV